MILFGFGLMELHLDFFYDFWDELLGLTVLWDKLLENDFGDDGVCMKTATRDGEMG